MLNSKVINYPLNAAKHALPSKIHICSVLARFLIVEKATSDRSLTLGVSICHAI